jgi:hypothetical protein
MTGVMEEPWIIAMDAPPTRARVLDYGLRWSIEAMFSDSKTRGFNSAKKPHPAPRPPVKTHPCGQRCHALVHAHRAVHSKKQKPEGSLKKFFRSILSAFKTGLRHLKTCAQKAIPPPKLKIMGW